MSANNDRSVTASAGNPMSPLVDASEPLQRDRARWNEIQRLFELCREHQRDDWHALLRAECCGQEGIAFEVMTLLVAAENLPPIEDTTQNSACM